MPSGEWWEQRLTPCALTCRGCETSYRAIEVKGSFCPNCGDRIEPTGCIIDNKNYCAGEV